MIFRALDLEIFAASTLRIHYLQALIFLLDVSVLVFILFQYVI